jgi:hypothetical protein
MPLSSNAFFAAVMVSGLFHPSVALNMYLQVFEGMMILTF